MGRRGLKQLSVLLIVVNSLWVCIKIGLELVELWVAWFFLFDVFELSKSLENLNLISTWESVDLALTITRISCRKRMVSVLGSTLCVFLHTRFIFDIHFHYNATVWFLVPWTRSLHWDTRHCSWCTFLPQAPMKSKLGQSRYSYLQKKMYIYLLGCH